MGEYTHSPSGKRDQSHQIKDQASKKNSNICTQMCLPTQKVKQGFTNNINVFACLQVDTQAQQITKMLPTS